MSDAQRNYISSITSNLRFALKVTQSQKQSVTQPSRWSYVPSAFFQAAQFLLRVAYKHILSTRLAESQEAFSSSDMLCISVIWIIIYCFYKE